MSGHLALLRFTALVDGLEMTPDLITGLVATALMQADIASHELYETVIPEFPPAHRAFPSAIARKIDRRDIFDAAFARDLQALIERLGGQVRDRTHIYFHADEHHVRGGYESVFREPGVQPLAAAIGELDLLYDLVAAACSAASAARVAENMVNG